MAKNKTRRDPIPREFRTVGELQDFWDTHSVADYDDLFSDVQLEVSSVISYRYTVILERNDEGGYTVTAPALKGCITQGDTFAEALENAREALQTHLEGLSILGKRIPTDIKAVRLGTDTSDEIFVVKVNVDADTKRAAREARLAAAA